MTTSITGKKSFTNFLHAIIEHELESNIKMFCSIAYMCIVNANMITALDNRCQC